jgi:hypothetical protein
VPRASHKRVILLEDRTGVGFARRVGLDVFSSHKRRQTESEDCQALEDPYSTYGT